MSNFECSLKDLNPQNENKQEYKTEDIETIKEPPNIMLSKNNHNIREVTTNSIINKLTEEKNVRIILLVIISYLITNSSQFTDFLTNTFPYLIESGTTNLWGKIVVAILIGTTVVIFTSFFQDL